MKSRKTVLTTIGASSLTLKQGTELCMHSVISHRDLCKGSRLRQSVLQGAAARLLASLVASRCLSLSTTAALRTRQPSLSPMGEKSVQTRLWPLARVT
jgi:hypothetical protein